MTDADHTTKGTGRRRGRPANTATSETVATVLAAARRQFAARGYAATTNKTVAEAAGLAHTAIYNHFGSKARLFTAVFVDVQDRLLDALRRSAQADPDRAAFPRVLLDAIENLRAEDPTYVDFFASMYVEVRRHPELREIFQGGDPFPIVDTLRQLAAGSDPDESEDSLWFWIAFSLGLAQLSALADQATFAATVDRFRRQLTTRPVADDEQARPMEDLTA